MNLTTEKCPFCDAWTKTTPWIHLLGELLFEINSSVWLFSKLLLFIINLSKMDWSNTVRGWLYFRTKTCTTSHEATWLHIYSLKMDDLLKLLWHLGSMDTSLSPYIYHEYVSSIVIRWKHTGRFWEVCFNFFFKYEHVCPRGGQRMDMLWITRWTGWGTNANVVKKKKIVWRTLFFSCE